MAQLRYVLEINAMGAGNKSQYYFGFRTGLPVGMKDSGYAAECFNILHHQLQVL